MRFGVLEVCLVDLAPLAQEGVVRDFTGKASAFPLIEDLPYVLGIELYICPDSVFLVVPDLLFFLCDVMFK